MYFLRNSLYLNYPYDAGGQIGNCPPELGLPCPPELGIPCPPEIGLPCPPELGLPCPPEIGLGIQCLYELDWFKSYW